MVSKFDLLVRVYAKTTLPYTAGEGHLNRRIQAGRVVEMNTDEHYYAILFWQTENPLRRGFENFTMNLPMLWKYFQSRGKEIDRIVFVEEGDLASRYKEGGWLGRTD